MKLRRLWTKVLAIVFAMMLLRMAFVALKGPPIPQPIPAAVSATAFATLEAVGELARCDLRPEAFAVTIPGLGRIRPLDEAGLLHSRAAGDPTAPILVDVPGERWLDRTRTILVYGTPREGRCHAFLIDQIPAGSFRLSRGEFLARVASVELGFTILTSLAVAIPLVRRIRRLAQQTRAVLDDDLRGDVAEGADELGELGRAFNQASQAARARLEDQRRRDDVIRTALADLAHDVRTPLGSIKLGIDRLLADPDDDLATATLRAEVDHVGNLFANVATLIQLEGSTIPLKLRRTDVREVVERVAARFRLLSAGRGVTVHLHLAAETMSADIDPVAFEQAVGNLVDNALKFGRRDLALLVFRRADEVVVQVRDDGPGVDPSETAKLTERGYRGRAAHSHNGSGLGLSIATEIVRRHDGRLELSRHAEGGTQAEIVLRTPGPARAVDSFATDA